MGALLALASALAYGIADYAGGLLSRRAHFGTVAFLGQAVVLSSLYPAVPVLLGVTLLHERVTPWQVCGLVCAGTAIGLLALG